MRGEGGREEGKGEEEGEEVEEVKDRGERK